MSTHATCTALPTRSAPTISMVVTFLFATAAIGVMHERTGWPSTCTVQAPQSAMPQPNLVPVSPRWSRSAHKSGVSSGRSTFWRLPLIMIGVIAMLLSPCRTSKDCGRPSLLHREHPNHPALRHVGLDVAELVDLVLHALRVDAPAGLNGDVLHAVHGERGRHGGDTRVGAPLPDGVTGFRVERAEVAVVGPAREDQPPARGQHWAPVVGLERARPHLLAAVHVPGLDLA